MGVDIVGNLFYGATFDRQLLTKKLQHYFTQPELQPEPQPQPQPQRQTQSQSQSQPETPANDQQQLSQSISNVSFKRKRRNPNDYFTTDGHFYNQPKNFDPNVFHPVYSRVDWCTLFEDIFNEHGIRTMDVKDTMDDDDYDRENKVYIYLKEYCLETDRSSMSMGCIKCS